MQLNHILSYYLSLCNTTFQNNNSAHGGGGAKKPLPQKVLLWAFLGGIHYSVPFGHRWRARFQKMNPLTEGLLVLEPNEMDPELKNH